MQPPNPQEAILILSHDVIGAQMAGPGIRYYHLAKVLSREFNVVLAIPCEPDTTMEVDNLQLVEFTLGEWPSLEPHVHEARVILMNGVLAGEFPQFAHLEIPLVIDGYDPLLAEWLTATQAQSNEQEAHWGAQMQRFTHQYLLGDFYLCASERQRDWWLGLLEAYGRVNPWNLRLDPSLRNLIDVVPFGLPETPPRHTHPVIRGVWPGIGPDDKILLWGGGLWPWLDPLTAIQAMERIWRVRQDVRLVFPGTRHPNPSMSQMPTHVETAKQQAGKLGLQNEGIFFGDWLPYQDWPSALLESDVALALHYEEALETHFAFRTRVLDYIWAGLPIVATRGDATSEVIQEYALGTLVPSQDADHVANAILQILDTPREGFRQGFEAARKELTWDRVALPLIEYCHNPKRAPDKVALGEDLGSPYYRLEIGQIKDDRARLLGEIAHEKSERKHLQEEVARLQQGITQLQGENARLQSEVMNLRNDSARLKGEVTEFQNDNARLRGEITALRDENASLYELVQAFEQRRIVRFLNWLRDLTMRLRF